MKTTLTMKIGCLLICVLLVISCATMPKSKAEKDFIILQTKDTIFAKKIQFSRAYDAVGTVKITKANGETHSYAYDEVYQLHHAGKKDAYYVEEMVMLTPGNPKSYVAMDVLIGDGNMKLYKHDPTNWGNTPFVVSNVYYDYVRTKKEYKNLLEQLKKCTAFREKIKSESTSKDKSLEELVTFYNANCGNEKNNQFD